MNRPCRHAYLLFEVCCEVRCALKCDVLHYVQIHVAPRVMHPDSTEDFHEDMFEVNSRVQSNPVRFTISGLETEIIRIHKHKL